VVIIVSFTKYCSPGPWSAKKNSKKKTEISRKLLFQKKVFLDGEKKNSEEYSLILEFAELSFPILNNYSAEMRRPCPRATVINTSFV
jgi:hypothetical protein